MGTSNDESALESASAVLADARTALTEARARDELLAEFVPIRMMGPIPRAATMRRIERVWRLGVLMLGQSGTLYATASTIRAAEPGHPNFRSNLAEERRQYRAAMAKARIPDGETVDFDASIIALDPDALRTSTGPLVLRDDGLRVRWSATAGEAALTPFDRYVGERVELLVHPPEGA